MGSTTSTFLASALRRITELALLVVCVVGCEKLQPSTRPSFTLTVDHKSPVEAHLKKIRDDNPAFDLRFTIEETEDLYRVTIVASGDSATEAEIHAQRAARFVNLALMDELVAKLKGSKAAKLDLLQKERAANEALLEKQQRGVDEAKARVNELRQKIEALERNAKPAG